MNAYLSDLIYGENDPLGWRFKSIENKIFSHEYNFEKLVDVQFVAKANHIFPGKESQKELNSIIDKWLLLKYPVGSH